MKVEAGSYWKKKKKSSKSKAYWMVKYRQENHKESERKLKTKQGVLVDTNI